MRSRIISREFWNSEDIADLTHTQRLLFIGLWCIADRDGLLLYKPRKISSEVFPYDAINEETTKKNLSKLEEANLIEFGHQGENVITCIYIPKFSDYQNIHPHEAQSKLKCNYMSLNDIECPPVSTSTSASVSVSTGDKQESGKPSVFEVASDILSRLNCITGKNFKRTTDIEACIKREKCTFDECCSVLDFKWQQWAGTEMQKNINPTTPFRAKHFQAYLDEARAGVGNIVAPKQGQQFGKFGVAERNLQALEELNKEMGYESENSSGIGGDCVGVQRADGNGTDQALLGGVGGFGRESSVDGDEGVGEDEQVFP